MSPTAIALLGFIGWALFLLVVIEVTRTKLVLFKQMQVTAFNPQNSNLSAFMQRLTRAHANCIEGLPIFGGLMLVALVTGNAAITDGLALIFLAARIAQTLIHLLSLGSFSVTSRSVMFTVQTAIGCYWLYGLGYMALQ